MLPPGVLGADRAAEPWWADQTLRTATPAPMPVLSGETPKGPAHEWGVSAILAAFAAGTVTPSALGAELLENAKLQDPTNHYLIAHLTPDFTESDTRWANGKARLLEGVPFAVKAIIDVAGAPVTCGSLTTGDRIATQDALLVVRLRAAGAVPIAIAATTEFAAGSPHNPRHGTVPNPWDASRWTGGSSTGSGGALAARLVPLAIGTDTGGSIRVPSAWCGITGLKPTRGLVPLEGVATLSWSLDHAGPMARSAADLVLPLQAMAGNLPQGSPRPLRIGIPDGWFNETCDNAVLDAWTKAQEVLSATTTLIPFRSADYLGDLAAAHAAAWDVLLTELAATQSRNAPLRAQQDKGLQHRIGQGEKIMATAYAHGLSMRSVMLARFMALFDALNLDLILTPGIGAEAGDLASLTAMVNGQPLPFQDIIPRNTMMFDLTGLPALMMPAGLGPNGLPLAVQLVGRPMGDGMCLAGGILFQSLTRHHLNAPGRS